MKVFILTVLLFCGWISFVPQAFGLDSVAVGEGDATNRGIFSYIPDFVKTPHGGVSWDLFAKTQEIPYSETDPNGLVNEGFRPKFSKDMKALDGQKIIMQGYMFPLEESAKQRNFLFGPFPINCPYHYHVGPALVIEAHAKKPIGFTYEPITITGILELVPRDDYYNVFYRLKDTKFLSSP
jgi:hypothetical protein